MVRTPEYMVLRFEDYKRLLELINQGKCDEAMNIIDNSFWDVQKLIDEYCYFCEWRYDDEIEIEEKFVKLEQGVDMSEFAGWVLFTEGDDGKILSVGRTINETVDNYIKSISSLNDNCTLRREILRMISECKLQLGLMAYSLYVSYVMNREHTKFVVGEKKYGYPIVRAVSKGR